VIKANANRRYNSESISTARFIHWCEEAGVPYQRYSHRYDLPCGSTIGPIASAKLGIRSVDIGCPMWAMHSLRESAGVLDHDYMIRVLKQFFSDYPPLHCTALPPGKTLPGFPLAYTFGLSAIAYCPGIAFQFCDSEAERDSKLAMIRDRPLADW